MSIFQRTGSEDFPDHLKVMISGPPKSGKTTFLATVPNIVIADTEPHANNLQSVAHKNIPYVTVNGTDDLQRLLFVLRDEELRNKAAEQLGMPKIEGVAIDTMDTLQQIMKRERLKAERRTQFQRDDWGWLKEEMTNVVRAFTALPLHVFFVMHTKTKEIGKEGDSRTVVLPNLEGAIAEDIAGMVGYSLLSFRKQEIRPDGSPFTKYWLRAEGDETYTFLGNRAAGRLPDIIEPNFDSVYDAAIAGIKAIQPGVQTHVSINEPDEPVSQPVSPAPAAQTLGQPPAGNDEPVNGAALSHIKVVYDACGLSFPEEAVKALTMGQARDLVRMWKAMQADHAAGKGTGETPAAEMITYLSAFDGLVAEVDLNGSGTMEAVVTAPIPVLDGTIDQVLAYAGDDLAKIQEAYEFEASKPKSRQTLLNALLNKGAKPASVIAAAAIDADTDAVTQDAEGADSMKQAESLIKEELGAKQIGSVDGTGSPMCDECGGGIDDPDIAVLARSRYGRTLCVKDYISETHKAKA